jgi:hypothetical protein
MLAVFTPGGLEDLFVASGRPADGARLPAGEGTAPGSLDALTARFGCEHVGPPLGG